MLRRTPRGVGCVKSSAALREVDHVEGFKVWVIMAVSSW